MTRPLVLALIVFSAFGVATSKHASAQQPPKVLHKTVKVGDLDIFYREAGPKDAPAILLLHGFPTSSQMFRNLIPALADKYRVVAPDYPGYGHSSMPPHDKFAYTFDNLAKVIDEFTEKVGLTKYALYVQDYGAPVGYRLAVEHPERITAIVVQNGNAYDEGLDNDFWKPIKAYWKEPKSKEKRDAIRNLLTYEATKWQYTTGVKNPELVSPDGAAHDQFLLDRKGNDEIQLDLFLSYGSNPPLYPKWQEYFRKHQPPMLIAWGKNDQIFPAAGAEPYKRDLKTLEYHLLDAGHFALETNGDEIAGLMRRVPRQARGQEVTPVRRATPMRQYPERRRLHPGGEGDPGAKGSRAELRPDGAGRGVADDRHAGPGGVPRRPGHVLPGHRERRRAAVHPVPRRPARVPEGDRRAHPRVRRLRRQPPVRHARQPVREPEGVPVPDGLRQQPAGEGVGHGPGGRGGRGAGGAAPRPGVPRQGGAGDPVHGRGVGRELPAAHPPAVLAAADRPGDRGTADADRRTGSRSRAPASRVTATDQHYKEHDRWTSTRPTPRWSSSTRRTTC